MSGLLTTGIQVILQAFSVSTLDSVDATCHLRHGVLLLLVDDGSSRLLHLDGLFFGLNPSGTAMLLESLHNPMELALAKLVERFQLTPSQIQQDMQELLQHLTDQKLISGSESGSVRQSTYRSVCAASVAALIRLAVRAPLSIEWRIAFLLPVTYVSIRTVGLATSFSICHSVAGSTLLDVAPDVIENECDRIRRTIQSRTARSWFPISCKERALCTYVTAQQSGIPAEVVLAVDLYPFRTHCWCQSEYRIISDDPENCTHYQPVAILLKFPSGSDGFEGIL